MTEKELLDHLRRGVIDGNLESCAEAAKEWLSLPLAPLIAVEKGLTPGIHEVGRLYEAGEFFLPELVSSAEAMKAGLNILRPAIAQGGAVLDKGTVIMATVEGDIHEIGKSIVAAILEAHGFLVHDLGADTKLDYLYQKIAELQPDVVGLSALLTTTMLNQKRAVEEIRHRGYRVKVIVGGAPVSREWAAKIGAAGYGKDAFEAAELVERLRK